MDNFKVGLLIYNIAMKFAQWDTKARASIHNLVVHCDGATFSRVDI